MDYITTTDLRTKSSQLIHSLEKGVEVSLIHRSKVVGRIQPVEQTAKLFDANAFKQLVGNLNLSPTEDSERKKTYSSHLSKKYGKGIS